VELASCNAAGAISCPCLTLIYYKISYLWWVTLLVAQLVESLLYKSEDRGIAIPDGVTGIFH